MICAGVRDLM